MSIEKIITELGIEYKAKSSYYTNCPKCSKGPTKLMVNIEQNNIRLFCFYAKCEWNTWNTISHNQSTENIEVLEINDTVPFPKEREKELKFRDNDQVYEYRDSSGQLLFVVVRTPDKRFTPYSLASDGGIYPKKYKGLSLFGAETLHNDDRPVLVVEGEKTCLAARKIFPKWDVVTWVGGSNRYKEGDWDLISNRQILLWPDNDSAGITAMNQVAQVIDSVDIYIANVGGILQSGEDLADNIPINTIKHIVSNKTHIDKKSSYKGEYNLYDYKDFVAAFKEGEPLGLKGIDESIKPPSNGIIVVSGRSGHGKTSVVINMLYNSLFVNKKQSVFFSMEYTGEQVIEKLINLQDTVLEKSTKYKRGVDSLGSSYDRLMDMRRRGMFRLFQNRMSLREIFDLLDNNSFNGCIVYLDYIQIVKTDYRSNEARYKEIQNLVYDLKDLASRRDQTIVISSQLTPGDHPDSDTARESKDINNAADLHIKVWNKSAAKIAGHMRYVYDKEGGLITQEYYKEYDHNILLSVVKNRWGAASNKKYQFELVNGTYLEGYSKPPTKKENNVDGVY